MTRRKEAIQKAYLTLRELFKESLSSAEEPTVEDLRRIFPQDWQQVLEMLRQENADQTR